MKLIAPFVSPHQITPDRDLRITVHSCDDPVLLKK